MRRAPITSILRRGLAAAALVTAITAAPASAVPDVSVAAGQNGSAHFAWLDTRIAGQPAFERALGGDGALGPPQAVSWAYRHVSTQAIGTDDAGNAVIAWVDDEGGFRGVRTRRRAADGTLGPVQLLSPAGASVSDMEFAVEPDGDAFAVWTRFFSNGKLVVQARRRAADGTLGPTLTLSYTGAHAFHVALAVAPSGAATVAWMRSGVAKYMQTRTVAPDGALSDLQRLSTPSETAAATSVTVSDAGTSVIAWARYTGTGWVLESRRRSASGSLAAVQTIAPEGEFAAFADTGGNGAGRTAYTWAKPISGQNGYVIMGRVRRADGGLGPAFEVDAGPSTEPQVAMAPDGAVTFAWTAGSGSQAVETRRRTAAGTLQATRTVSQDGAGSSRPRIAVGDDGKAVLAWSAPEGRWHARTVTAGGSVSALLDLTGR